MSYRVSFTRQADRMLASISDRRIQARLINRAMGLEEEPDSQGSSLYGELAGFRSVRAVGQRYRIIYQVGENSVIVISVGIRRAGARSDVYSLMTRLVRLGIVNPP